MNRVLVTGASGFVGSALVSRLKTEPGIDVVSALRKAHDDSCLELGDLERPQFSTNQLKGFTSVVHTAARVHVMRDQASDPLAEFRRINTAATLALADAAAKAGVRRFIFISSIKVNGETTRMGAPFRADDLPAPQDPYAISKLEAEQGLFQLAQRTGLEVVVVRPPLVYGPGVRANFQSMMRWLRFGVPLPLGGIENRRSLVALDNLVDLLVCCLGHPAAVGQVFLVSDGKDLSTTELLKQLGAALGTVPRLWGWTGPMLKSCLLLMNQDALVRRLFGSLQVDISKTRTLLDWNPPVDTYKALTQTAEHFLRQREQI
ncbi:NAD-dependent epimerase/dehydratase family protein [Pseudomonas sp. GOM6]|uniref:NAD-dependent epimerase/dehydratase family protein n=1 Tax=Pseudomonas sp. GOM6 TaxID=3036944 RepID=UPI00240982D3|nr:NAD-dependent epimerase/dehydratase family protein [Pseudomonas sp. GOM6]MDG1581668.1 NAD-dependent epimerase/dehydratase family protein [Pseudomonas sp. GOM6]